MSLENIKLKDLGFSFWSTKIPISGKAIKFLSLNESEKKFLLKKLFKEVKEENIELLDFDWKKIQI